MTRHVNMTGAPLDNAHLGPRAARVPPGEAGDFNVDNPSVKQWLRARLIVSEGEVLASRATALADAPSAAALLKLRQDVANRDVVIEDLRARDAARVAEMGRMEARFGELARAHDDADILRAALSAQGTARAAAEAETAQLRAAAELAADALRAELASTRARVAELEALLATATAPAPPATEGAKPDADAPPATGRTTRRG